MKYILFLLAVILVACSSSKDDVITTPDYVSDTPSTYNSYSSNSYSSPDTLTYHSYSSADSSASTAVSGQTQTDIFSKLTNGGKAQWIYLDENGNVYVNGEFFRDHLWVSEEKFAHLRKMCKHNASQFQVQFKAKVREYRTVGPTKLGLVAIKDVTTLSE